MNGNGKAYGEGNVHVARWRIQAEKSTTEYLVDLYNRLPKPRGGRFTQRHMVIRRELERRNLSLRDLGIDPPKAAA
jgi:hypothetical protein